MVVDDHQMFVDGLRMMIDSVPEMELKYVACDGKEALKIVGSDSDIDVMITDISMPELSGIELCRELQSAYPHIRVLILSMHNDPANIKEVLNAGALGYILKNTGQSELIEAIRKVYDREVFYSEAVKNTIMSSMTRAARKSANTTARLSKREVEIIQLIAEEYTTTEIAERLFISLHTVESHRKNILRKTNSRNLAGLIKYALREGIVE